jgi:hypothetical protein
VFAQAQFAQANSLFLPPNIHWCHIGASVSTFKRSRTICRSLYFVCYRDEMKSNPWSNQMNHQTRLPFSRTGLLSVLTIGTLSLFSGFTYAADISKFISFDEALKINATAQYENYAKQVGVRVKGLTEFDQMRAHVMSLYEGVKVRNSFVFAEDHIDCVAVETQPGLRISGSTNLRRTLAKAPPPRLARETADEDIDRLAQPVTPMLSVQKMDAHGNAQFCSDGFIPMRRVAIDELVGYETLGDFFNKYGKVGERGLPIAQ